MRVIYYEGIYLATSAKIISWFSGLLLSPCVPGPFDTPPPSVVLPYPLDHSRQTLVHLHLPLKHPEPHAGPAGPPLAPNHIIPTPLYPTMPIPGQFMAFEPLSLVPHVPPTKHLLNPVPLPLGSAFSTHKP